MGAEKNRSHEKAPRRKPRSNKPAFDDYVLANIRMTADEQQVFETEADSYFKPFDVFLSEQLALGRKVSFSALDDNQTVIVSVTGKDPADSCYLQTMSAFGESPETAITVWNFKDEILCGEASWQVASEMRAVERPRYG